MDKKEIIDHLIKRMEEKKEKGKKLHFMVQLEGVFSANKFVVEDVYIEPKYNCLVVEGNQAKINLYLDEIDIAFSEYDGYEIDTQKGATIAIM